MKITLVKLHLVNFKGIRNMTIDCGSVTNIYGDNATGKTTLFDGFNYLLFDKDSQNKKEFGIKTADANGNVLHGLDHEVEGTLRVDGRKLTLRKVFSEKWTKKRGSASEEFTGHTTDYFVDGVPVKLKEYKDRIDSLIDESVFKLLTSPTYFNEQLSWQDRRRTLLEVCGDLTDAEVIASNDALSALPGILDGRAIEDHRKVLAAKRKEINDELDKIPVRIDEAERSKPDTEGLNETALQAEIEQLKFEVDTKSSELNRLQTGGEVAEQQKRLSELEGELMGLKNQKQSGAMDEVTKQRQVVMKLSDESANLTAQIKRLEKTIEQNKSDIESYTDDADRWRKEWVELNGLPFQPVVDDKCAACGQDLPHDQVQEVQEKALAEYNHRKSKRLEHIAQSGKSAKSEAERLTVTNAKHTDELGSLMHQLSAAQDTEDSAHHELDCLQAVVQDVSTDTEYIAKQAEIAAVQGKIVALRSSSLAEVERVRTELMDLRDSLRRKETLLARFEQVRNTDKRIDELKKHERTLSAEFERLQEELYLTEEFTRAKVALLESRINSKFQYARFKLFDTQINGGLSETCETLYQGVPYGSGLNNAARINVGLDIINTLSEHYGISAPVVIDNAEAVTQLASTDSQVIALYVSERDKQLRVETDNLKEAV